MVEMQMIGAKERQLSEVVALMRLGRRLPLFAMWQSLLLFNRQLSKRGITHMVEHYVLYTW